MRLILFLGVALAASSLVASGEQQRILRRVIKSTPTASSLGRVRAVTVRSPGFAEKGTVSEISAKEAAQFGKRAANETTSAAPQQQQQQAQATQTALEASKTKGAQAPVSPAPTTSSSSSTTSTATSTTSTTAATPAGRSTATTSTAPTPVSSERPSPKASERQQAAPAQPEVELLSGAPSSWQMMTAVEAPAAAALIAVGARAASTSQASDLSSSSSEEASPSYAPQAQGDFLRAAASGKTSYSQSSETFSRLRQQSSASKTRQVQQQQQQQSFFYPQQQQLRAPSKTSNYQATKTHWYQPTSTTPRPAPIVQEPQQQQQYEQQSEQYVEQQHVESAAPPGQAEPFAFDFNTQDTSGNGQYRKEESDNNGVVRGSYGFRDASGMYRHVEYVADANGFRANIKSNEPGLVAPEGDSQPASIRLTTGQAPPQQQQAQRNQRFSAGSSSSEGDNSGEWQAASSSSNERADLALAPPDFESSHRPERVRVARHFRN